MHIQNVLLIQTAFLGDLVLTTPFLNALLEEFPTAHFSIISTTLGEGIFQSFPRTHVFSIEKKGWNLLENKKKLETNPYFPKKFDLIWCVHRSLRSLLLGRFWEAKQRVGFESWGARALGYKTVPYPSYDPQVHYADKLFHLFRALNLNVSRKTRPILYLEKDIEENLSKKNILWSQLRQDRYILIAPFAAWATKMWPIEKYIQLTQRLLEKTRERIVFIGGHTIDEKKKINQLLDAFDESNQKRLFSFVGDLNIQELKWVIDHAKLLVANDSAPVHLASAFNIPTVAIFGPTSALWGFRPLSACSVIVENTHLPCRPCHLHGPKKCPLQHFRCMREILVEDVLQAVQNIRDGTDADSQS